MKAKDVMTSAVVTVSPETPVQEIAHLLNTRRISAMPVIDHNGNLVGMVSEGDLIQRPETGGERHTSWWLSLLSGTEKAQDYVKSHGRVARDIMTKTVVSTTEEASLASIAQLLEKHRVKRVPILHDGKLVGIVSRADLLHGMIGLQSAPASTSSDRVIRDAVGAELRRAGVRSEYINIVVAAGVVDLWGMVHDEVEVTASRLAAEQVPGVQRVNNHLNVIPANVQGRMGGE